MKYRIFLNLFLILLIINISLADLDDSQTICENAGHVWLHGSIDYPATHSFTDDIIGRDPAGWDISEPGYSRINVISEKEGHKNVAEIWDDSENYGPDMKKDFSLQPSGTIEFWVYGESGTVGQDHLFVLVGRGTSGDQICLQADWWSEKDSLSTCDDVHTIIPSGDFPSNIWHHIRLYFDNSIMNFSLWHNEISKGEFNYSAVGNYTDNIAFGTYYAGVSSSGNFHAYVDAIDFSWDSGGDNDIPPCCGDDGSMDNFDNSTHQCVNGVYLGEGDNAKILCTNAGYIWMENVTEGTNGSCCGDDDSEDFSNSTHKCENKQFSYLSEPDETQTTCESCNFSWIEGATGDYAPCCGDDGELDDFENSSYKCENSILTALEFCGNGVCAEDETSETCCNDCGCGTGYACQDSTCVEELKECIKECSFVDGGVCCSGLVEDENKCIKCDGNIQSSDCGGSGLCKSACGADSECNNKIPGISDCDSNCTHIEIAEQDSLESEPSEQYQFYMLVGVIAIGMIIGTIIVIITIKKEFKVEKKEPEEKPEGYAWGYDWK